MSCPLSPANVRKSLSGLCQKKPKVFVTRKVHEEALSLLRSKCSVEVWDSEEPCPRQTLIEKVKGVDAIFCTISDKIDKAVIDAAGCQLKKVSSMSRGLDHISTLTCRERNIYVMDVPDVATDSAAELTVTLLLTTARRVMEGRAAVKNGEWGKWKPMWICGTEMSNRTLGILGLGRVGYGVARRMQGFGLTRIIYHDIERPSMAGDVKAEFVDLDTLLSESDFLVISCTLTGSTTGWVNKDVFSKMKKESILINISRGLVVNTDDLVEALKSGQIAAAGLDVTEPEPLPKHHPLVAMDNCVILPHLGTNSVRARRAMAMSTAKNIVSFFYPKRLCFK